MKCFVVLLCVFTLSYSASLEEKDAICRISSQLSIESWSSLCNDNPCLIPNITCSKVIDGEPIIKLDISNKNLSGTIVTQIGKLNSLTSLVLNNNNLTGSIPVQLKQLVNLRTLDVGLNGLHGTLPDELVFLLINLEYIDFSYTNLDISSLGVADTIYQVVETLVLDGLKINDDFFYKIITNYLKLKRLSVTHNDITFIPYQIEQLTNLVYLNLGNNSMAGTVPKQLGNLINLEELYINSDGLKGNLPIQLASLPKLRVLNFNASNVLCPQLTIEPNNTVFKEVCGSFNSVESEDLSGNIYYYKVLVNNGNLFTGKNMSLTTDTLTINQNSNLLLLNSTITAKNTTMSSLNLTISNQNEPVFITENLNVSSNSYLNITFLNDLKTNQTIINFKVLYGNFSKVSVNGKNCNYEITNNLLTIYTTTNDCEQQHQPYSGEQKMNLSYIIMFFSIIFVIIDRMH